MSKLAASAHIFPAEPTAIFIVVNDEWADAIVMIEAKSDMRTVEVSEKAVRGVWILVYC